jgi:hypothetical protein
MDMDPEEMDENENADDTMVSSEWSIEIAYFLNIENFINIYMLF